MCGLVGHLPTPLPTRLIHSTLPVNAEMQTQHAEEITLIGFSLFCGTLSLKLYVGKLRFMLPAYFSSGLLYNTVQFSIHYNIKFL